MMDEDEAQKGRRWPRRLAIGFIIFAFLLSGFLFLYQTNKAFYQKVSPFVQPLVFRLSRKKPLFHAIVEGDIKTVKWHISKGTNLDKIPFVEEMHLTPVTVACSDNQYEIAKLLLQSGASPDPYTSAKDAKWWNVPALGTVAMKGKEEFVKLLLNFGANPNLPDYKGKTALYYAARSSLTSVETVKYLLSNGANYSLKDNKGRTPLDIARLEGRAEIVTLLEEWIKEHPESPHHR